MSIINDDIFELYEKMNIINTLGQPFDNEVQ